MQTEISHEMIAKRAYELFQRRGGQHGADVQDWLAAEQQLRAEMATQAQPSRATSTKTAGKALKGRTSANKTSRRSS